MYYYEVAPTKIFRAGADLLTYASTQDLPPGTLAIIPLGKKTIPGLVIRPVKQPDFPCKPIERTLYHTPLPPHLLKSLFWLATYYATPLPTVLQTALPRGLNKTRRVKSSSDEQVSKLLTYGSVSKMSSSVEQDLQVSGLDDLSKRGSSDEQDSKLLTYGSVSKRGLQTPTSSPTAATATREDGLARGRSPISQQFGDLQVLLNPAQHRALKELAQNPSNTLLLHGITGSGKTNIYLHLAHQTIANKQSLILLVPEIALTSQLIVSFRQHFQNVTLLHSKQTESERHLLWQHLLNTNEPTIIIGPRSALFAPVKNLGLIIIDEAHEPSYHQDQSPKYSALRLASAMTGFATNARTILGTATPNIADYYLCQQKSAIIELNELAIKSGKTATTQVIDLKDRANFKTHRLFSTPLLKSIEQSLDSKTQTLIFHNRRGSAPLTICDHCGWQALCPRCLLPLTLHTDSFQLLCHTCGHTEKIPTGCPVCKNADITHKGLGTKLLETELARLFPTAKIARLDADNKDISSETIYHYITDQKPDIIIGTQILAKGFDFPSLTTLGIPQADAGLALPDFTSEERTFQLLTQVIGRANRGHQNTNIIIQTYQPDHPSIRFGATSDYQSLYNSQIQKRQISRLPPFTYLLKLSLTYKTELTCIKNIQQLAKAVRNLKLSNCESVSKRGMPAPISSLAISPPTPAFHEHTPSGFTWQLIVKSKSRQPLLDLIKNLPTNPHLHLSLDPPTLL